MFLKTDYGAILGGLDAPMAKGIVLTDCTKKTKGAFLVHLERGECHARISEKRVSEKRLERSD